MLDRLDSRAKCRQRSCFAGIIFHLSIGCRLPSCGHFYHSSLDLVDRRALGSSSRINVSWVFCVVFLQLLDLLLGKLPFFFKSYFSATLMTVPKDEKKY
jgi:hypothetical protein